MYVGAVSCAATDRFFAEFPAAEPVLPEEFLAEELPEVGDFLQDFLPAYGQTLDELTGQI